MAENNVDEAKLKELDEQIEAKEKEKFSAFISIGRKYYELNAAKHEEAYLEWINQIEEAEKAVASMEAQKCEIRGFYICECGTEVPKKSTFCPECGRKIVKLAMAVPEGFVQCPKCSSLVEAGAKFCGNCGEKISATIKQEETIVEEVEMEDDLPSFTVEKRCAVCNELLAEGAKVCFTCGSKVAN